MSQWFFFNKYHSLWNLNFPKGNTPVHRNSFYYDRRLSVGWGVGWGCLSTLTPGPVFSFSSRVSLWLKVEEYYKDPQILPRCCFQNRWQYAFEVISLPKVSARNLLELHHPPKALLLSRSMDVLAVLKARDWGQGDWSWGSVASWQSIRVWLGGS